MRRPPLDRSLDWALLALGALVVASTAARFLLSSGVAAPWIAPDEQLYGLLGRSLVDGDGLRLLGEPVSYYSTLYPLLVGFPFLWSGAAGAVRDVQALQALVMSLTAVPVFFWARSAAGSRWALVASGLSVLIPGLVYSGLFMSEALYYPLATLTAFALARCLVRPTLVRQAVLLGTIALALATRLQAIGFVAVVVAAVAVLAIVERSRGPIRHLLPTLGLLAVAGVAYVGSSAFGGGGQLLGGYSTLGAARSYSLTDVAQSIAWQTGALTLVTVGIPLIGLGVLTWEALRGSERDPEVRALVATAVAYVSVTLLEVSAFASRFVEHVTERQLLSIMPPVFVAFVVWLRRGAPRPQPFTSIFTFVLAASALLLPLDRVTAPAAYADAPSMIPLERLSHHVSQSAFEGVYAVGAGLLLLLGVLLPRRFAPALAGVVALVLVSGSLAASHEIRNRSKVERARTFAGVSPDWIDAAGADDVLLLLTGQRLWTGSWENLFWNRSIARVVRLPGVQSPGAIPQQVAHTRADGRLVTRGGAVVDAPFVAAPNPVSLVGEAVATLPTSFEEPGMTLWRVQRPLRVSARVIGLKPNGDIYGHQPVKVRVFACGKGNLELTLLGKEGRETRIVVDGRVAAARRIPPDTVWRPSVPAPASADGTGLCVFEIESDGLIGSTRVEFVRG